MRKKSFADTAGVLKPQLDQQITNVKTLKGQLIALESKISEAKTKKNMLTARAKAAQAQKQIQETMGNIGSSGAMAAFERMEDKVMELEAVSQSAAELGGSGLEEQFKQLEASGIDDELEAMKAQLTGGSVSQEALPAAEEEKPSSSSNSAIDAELENLRDQLKKM